MNYTIAHAKHLSYQIHAPVFTHDNNIYLFKQDNILNQER